MVAAAAAQSPASVSMSQIAPAPGPVGQAVRVPAITGVGVNGGPRSNAASAPTQVGGGARTATAPPALSSAAQGRAVGVPVLTGADGCEPGSALAGSQICEQRIETRADQYPAPTAAPISAEGRLLMLMTPASQGTADDARRIGESGSNLQDFVGQAAGQVAAVLGSQQAASTPEGGPYAPYAASRGLPPTVVINPGR